MTWSPYRAAGKAILGGARLGAQAGEQLATASALNRAGRGARRGYLAPGDPTPPPSGPTDYFDYRGLATWGEARNLAGQPFRLGAFLDLQRKGKPHGPIGLPEAVLKRHATVIGPAGSGKTHGVLVPWMHCALAGGWSVVAVDVKGDMQERLLRYEQESSLPPSGAKLSSWDFGNPQHSLTWDWLAQVRDDAQIDAAITAILGRRDERSAADPFFYQRDYRTLRGLIRFAATAAPWVKTAGALMRMLEDDRALETLTSRNSSAPGAADLQAVLRYPPSEYAKVISGVVTALSVLDSAAVDEVTQPAALRRPLHLARALEEHRALFVVAPLSGGQLSVTLSGLLLGQLKQRLFERFGATHRPVLLVIDEAAQLMDRIEIKQLMEVARSAEVGVVLALQDAAQIADKNERSSILSNSATLTVLPGVSPLTVEQAAKRLGTRTERAFSLSSGPTRQSWPASRPTQTYNAEQVPVLREREIAEPPFGARPAIVHVQAREVGVTTKPLLVDLAVNRAR